MRGFGRFGDSSVPTPAMMTTPGAVAAGAQANQGAVRPFTGRIPVTLDQLNVYNPNRADAIEAIWQPFYDFTTYAAAGQTQLQFFQVQTGQGGKTLADTNMLLGGQFPAPTAFLCTAIMVGMFANNTGLANVQTGPNTTAAAAAALPNANDTLKFLNSGYLQITIGSKTYLTDAPVGKFPVNFTMGGLEAVSGTFAAGTFMATDFARGIGRYYEITPFLIPMTQNFVVTLNWPVVVALTNPARVGVILDGFYYRQSQ